MGISTEYYSTAAKAGSSNTDRTKMGALVACILVLLAACSGSGSGSGGGGGGVNPPPPIANASPGGVWTGSSPQDIFDRVITLLATESGSFRFVIEGGSQGTGTLNVSGGTTLTGDFKYGLPVGETFTNETLIMNCTLSGSVTEYQSMTLDVDCSGAGGERLQWTMNMTYVNSYERDSSLATIAGNYQDTNAVLSIAGDGSYFSQDPVTNCVINGQVSIIDSNFDLYAIESTYSDCIGDHESLNGAAILGLAVLDNSASPEVLSIFGTAELGSNAVISVVQVLERL